MERFFSKFFLSSTLLLVFSVCSIMADPVWVSVGINKISAAEKNINKMSEYVVTLKTESDNQLFKSVIPKDDLLFKELQKLLITDGLTFKFSTDLQNNIYDQVIKGVNSLKDGDVKNIKKYMIQNAGITKIKEADSTDTIKNILKQALKVFEARLESNIIQYCQPQKETVHEQNSDTQKLRNVIKGLKFERAATQEEVLRSIENIDKLLLGVLRFTPTIDLFDNKSQFVMPYRALYYEIEQLGKFFGFTCTSIDSTWAQYAWRHKWKLFLGIGGIGAIAVAYHKGMLAMPSMPSLRFPKK